MARPPAIVPGVIRPIMVMWGEMIGGGRAPRRTPSHSIMHGIRRVDGAASLSEAQRADKRAKIARYLDLKRIAGDLVRYPLVTLYADRAAQRANAVHNHHSLAVVAKLLEVNPEFYTLYAAFSVYVTTKTAFTFQMLGGIFVVRLLIR
jgi:hypothetical protein